ATSSNGDRGSCCPGMLDAVTDTRSWPKVLDHDAFRVEDGPHFDEAVKIHRRQTPHAGQRIWNTGREAGDRRRARQGAGWVSSNPRLAATARLHASMSSARDADAGERFCSSGARATRSRSSPALRSTITTRAVFLFGSAPSATAMRI